MNRPCIPLAGRSSNYLSSKGRVRWSNTKSNECFSFRIISNISCYYLDLILIVRIIYSRLTPRASMSNGAAEGSVTSIETLIDSHTSSSARSSGTNLITLRPDHVSPQRHGYSRLPEVSRRNCFWVSIHGVNVLSMGIFSSSTSTMFLDIGLLTS